MKTLMSILAVLLLLGVATAQVFVTNNVTRAAAIKVASQLRVGMWEEDASKLVAKHSLTNAVGIGAVAGWGRFYTLADGTSLVLDYRAREIARDGRWGGNGELQRAFIQSNGVNIVFITLTNTP